MGQFDQILLMHDVNSGAEVTRDQEVAAVGLKSTEVNEPGRFDAQREGRVGRRWATWAWTVLRAAAGGDSPYRRDRRRDREFSFTGTTCEASW